MMQEADRCPNSHTQATESQSLLRYSSSFTETTALKIPRKFGPPKAGGLGMTH